MPDWITLTTKAEKGSNLTSAEADSIVSAVRQLQGAYDDALIGFNPRGIWAAGTVYALGDLAEVDGSSYVSAIPHTSTAVFADDLAAGYWQLVAERGAQAVAVTPMGNWDSGTTYAQGNMVSREGRLYVAVISSINQQPPNVLYWEPLRDYQQLYGVDVSVDTSLSMAAWQDNTIFYLSGTLTGPSTLTVPDLAKAFVLRGQWSGGYPVTIKTAAGVGFEMESGDQVIATNTGADVVPIFSVLGGEALSDTVEQLAQRIPIEGSVSWTPGAIPGNSRVTQSVSVPGAVIGDFVEASYSATLSSDLVLYARVNAADSVTAILRNASGSSITPTPGTVRVLVIPHLT